MATTWQLFIDESGNFENPSDTCVVAGLLVRAASHPRDDAKVRAALEAACPGLDYPLHASTARYLSGRVHATLVSTQRQAARPSSERDLAMRGREALQGLVQHPVAASLLEHIDARREPGHGLFQRCDELLREHAPDVARRLKSLVINDASRVREVLRRSGELFGASSADGAFVAAAVDVRSAGGDEVEDTAVRRDRYLALLRELLGRVGVLLHGRASEIWVTAANRHVDRVDVGAFPLGIANVGAAATAAMKFPLLAVGDGAPRFIPAGVPRYDDSVRPGIVLADFLSNRVRNNVLGADNIAWHTLAGQLKDRIWLDGTSTTTFAGAGRKLPAIADAGRAQAAIWRAFDGEKVDDKLGGLPRWSRDQAQAWTHAGAAWRATRGLA